MINIMPTANETTTPPPFVARCPSCGHTVTFTFLGYQKWPPRVAQITGKSCTTLWQCEKCSTTLSDPETK
jgi:ribosomal protein S27E